MEGPGGPKWHQCDVETDDIERILTLSPDSAHFRETSDPQCTEIPEGGCLYLGTVYTLQVHWHENPALFQ